MVGPHRHANISKHVDTVLKDKLPQVDRSDVTATSDNASNEIKALEEDLDLRRIPCMGHLLHNCVKFGLKDPRIKGLVERAATIAKLLHKSSSVRGQLEEKQKIAFRDNEKLIGKKFIDIFTRVA